MSQGSKTIAAAALFAAAIGSGWATAAKAPKLGVEVLPRSGIVIPVKLTCPKERKSCVGTASFKGKKERRGKIYRLESAPFDFKKFDGGKRKTIKFRLSTSAQETLKKANGMTVTVVIKARYGSGKPNTIKVPAKLSP